jgi:hypothetical protein
MFFCKDQDQSVSLDAFQERLRQTQQVHADNADTLAAALRLIADIREAAGDPEGKLMQDELVERIRRMRKALEKIQALPVVRHLAEEALK